MQARHVAAVLPVDAIVDLDAEVELAEELREVEGGNVTEDIALDCRVLVVVAAHNGIGEQVVVHKEPVVDILEAAAEIDLVDQEEDNVVGQGEPNSRTADLAGLLVALVEGSRKVAVVVVVALEEVDSNLDQVVPVPDSLAGPEGSASMEVVVKSLCEIEQDSS
ncbi:hypothetical protein FGSG_12510 [Fusarium graminearum PH-1]|uniref:hypothetical protein n=1 Tax=Gibberella zeae (strain ATCC MYA-4620 / CBS 123657 / FGSC 9075 / NRRL 31084 / PH-1) TaxID=229533 RepID=UPI00021F21DA|nr:hypothetical protein FGSG_12510 [Fusarium graminearum PH-1]ESU10181.1 hypothetical protein FGSG_12510 [Fusarium graminearum PH-1]|eukprot:XP_011322680.1 hypothetical protein FGSG_12510 [Fusarium graminearum PH-1]